MTERVQAVRVLLVEDDQSLRQFLATTLAANGYAVAEADSCAALQDSLQHHSPELMLLDIGLPDGDSLAMMDFIRASSDCSILILSARDQDRQKVEALDAGADDYLSKPFSMEELLARLRALMRRRTAPAASVWSSGELLVDVKRRAVEVEGCEVHLTPIEFRLLVALVNGDGSVVTHARLMEQVWGRHLSENTHYLRIYMRQLRGKIEANPAQPRYLRTVPGVGYALIRE
ncbi:MAG: response regulator [Moraxellaceae bacterium]|nr:response regulator [Moraxellaceae bacterium]